ncbi:hypothetical protein WMY93_018388 [Mugilogobius chulae]|uniref:Uncharacterized protein n=1 Tax=Mugilogobius chulae TaxID=88201 RepID=A0AAW0NQ82_9GOBI
MDEAVVFGCVRRRTGLRLQPAESKQTVDGLQKCVDSQEKKEMEDKECERICKKTAEVTDANINQCQQKGRTGISWSPTQVSCQCLSEMLKFSRVEDEELLHYTAQTHWAVLDVALNPLQFNRPAAVLWALEYSGLTRRLWNDFRAVFDELDLDWTNLLPDTDAKYYIVTLIVVVPIVLIFPFLLLMGHVRLILNNRTTIEHKRAPVFIDGMNKKGFYLGVRRNLAEVFGDQPFYWFIPVFSSLGDGQSFDRLVPTDPEQGIPQQNRNSHGPVHGTIKKYERLYNIPEAVNKGADTVVIEIEMTKSGFK